MDLHGVGVGGCDAQVRWNILELSMEFGVELYGVGVGGPRLDPQGQSKKRFRPTGFVLGFSRV